MSKKNKKQNKNKKVPFVSEQINEKTIPFFDRISKQINLPKREKKAMLEDFDKALIMLNASGVSFEEAMHRLDVVNLGGFYSRPATTWFPIDNAAKIYPVSMSSDNMALFRLSVYLKEDVIPEILQMALTFTIKRFPTFATSVKKGIFWHYLETTKRRYVALPDTGVPCHHIKVGASGSQTFRLMYYKNRISVELFHILSDGTGGMAFLKTIVAEYFRILGTPCESTNGVLPVNGIVSAGELTNEFPNVPTEGKPAGFMDKTAMQFGGKLSKVRPCQVLHFKLDAAKLKKVAKSRNATVTAYLLSRMFAAGRNACDEISGEFSVMVPVNMRKYYPSETLRNFSMYCGIREPLTDIKNADDLIPDITAQLEKKASKESMTKMVASTNNMIKLLRFIPLFLMAPVAKRVYGVLGEKIFSTTLSNLGVVKFPAEIEDKIESLDFVLGTVSTNRLACSSVTFGNTCTFSVSKNTADSSFEDCFYELLCADGLDPVVEGSVLIED